MSEHHLENETPVLYLDCKQAFDGLSDKEKTYVHLLNRASWIGGLICLVQTSPESPGLFLLLQSIFHKQPPQKFEELAKSIGFSEDEIKAAMVYIAAVYGNLGNYKSFGDSKFVPAVDEVKFTQLIESTDAFKSDKRVQNIWNSIKKAVFSLDSKVLNLGFAPTGLTAFFSSNCTREDAETAQKFMDEKNLSGYNTRLFKVETNGQSVYHIKQASANKGKAMDTGDAKFVVEMGDYNELMSLMVEKLKLVQKAALNETEQNMFKHYIASFINGSIEEHKTGSRFWIKDKGPVVENYIGFIESYRDPYGVRGEFESFVAVVNKEMSSKFTVLVDKAPSFLSSLPWGPTYEKDTFLQPDFTSLDIVNFATGGIPIGINIPNYDDIRQSEGFKNVSLGNVLASRFKDPKVNFLTPDDKILYLKHIAESFEIQVGLHELIGHGSGKLFKMGADGKLNFDKDKVLDLVNGGSIKSWYGPNETWDSKFTDIASPIEECRAECVGVYLCNLPEVLTVFGHNDPQVGQDVAFINWLSMARAGVASLELYTPTTGAWRQAHSQARFAILQVMLEAGQGLLSVDVVTAEDDQPDILIKMDRTKIESVARPAVGDFLKKLQFYKSVGDAVEGRAFFLKYSNVNEHFTNLRAVVLARKQPRPLIAQCNTKSTKPDTEAGSISMVEYEATPGGLIQSFLDRFSDMPEAETALEAVWRRDMPYFQY